MTSDTIATEVGSFTNEDVEAIASLPLTLMKTILNEAQFNAVVKFVNINQMMLGKPKVHHDA